jgi:hypothetical protein
MKLPEDGPKCGLKHVAVIKSSANYSTDLFFIVVLTARIPQIILILPSNCICILCNSITSKVLEHFTKTKRYSLLYQCFHLCACTHTHAHAQKCIRIHDRYIAEMIMGTQIPK